jgi:DNA-binding NtrC family response regulator
MARIQKQQSLALPPDLKEQIERAANAAGHSSSEEIRRRLVQSFAAEEAPSATRHLQKAVERFAILVEKQLGEWATHPGAARALRAAIDSRLARHGADKKWKGEDPAAIGVGIENSDYAVFQRLQEADEVLAGELTQIEEMLAEAKHKDDEETIKQLEPRRDALRDALRRLAVR